MNIDDYAKSARFFLTDEERNYISKRAGEFNFDAIKNIDTENIKPMYTVLDVQNIMREGLAEKKFSRDVLLSAAPEQYGGYFQVPKAIE
jgi:aspartyl-tRNA(Asn)/glutamyl-tRNA(Gln) amidotransferase subunit C